MPSASLRHRLSVVAIALLLPLAAFAIDNVTITVSPVPPDRVLARAGGDPATSLVTVLGETVTLTVTNGRDYTLEGIGGLAGARFDAMPTDGDVVRITPEGNAENGYLLRVQTSRWRNGRVRLFSSTVAAKPGKWVRLWGEDRVNSRKVIRFSAGKRPDAFYVMVRP